MKPMPSSAESIRDCLVDGSVSRDWFLYGISNRVAPTALLRGTCLGGRFADLAGKSILVIVHDQLAAALTVAELDGVAKRLVLCPADISDEHLEHVAVASEADAAVVDRPRDLSGLVALSASCQPDVSRAHKPEVQACATEWVLFTSGTTGVPKLLVHDFGTLTRSIVHTHDVGSRVVWGTFTELRRYGGVTALLRALLGHSSLVLASPGRPPGEQAARFAAAEVTHASGTPSHWRLALMSSAAPRIRFQTIRVGGEIVDQAILNALRAAYPHSQLDHIFGSTESGFGFSVGDGLAGFPAEYVGVRAGVEIHVADGSVRLRSSYQAHRYVVDDGQRLKDDAGFVDTGDMVERRGARYVFLGRRSGLINVGGAKVHPEEIETVINSHPAVRMSRVYAQRSSITGSLVAADVALKGSTDGVPSADDADARRQEILQLCRDRLDAYKVPARIEFVSSLDIQAGKVVRRS